MLKSIVLTTCLFSCSTLVAQSLSGMSWAEAQKTKSGKIVAYYLQEDIYAYPGENGEPQGIEIDIFKQFVSWVKNAKGIILDVDYVGEANFAKFYGTVQNGGNGLIGLGTVTILERRKTEVQFSPPFINNIAVLISHAETPELDKMSSIARIFKGKKAVVAKGTTLETYMRELKEKYYPDLVIELVGSQFEVPDKIAGNPDYFGYVDLHIYWTALEKQKKAIRRQPAGDLNSEVFGFIVPVESDWIGPLTEFFSLGTGYRSSAGYKTILMKHLGGEVTRMLQMAQKNH